MILFARSLSVSISKIFFNSLKSLILKALTNFFDGEIIEMSFIYINTINFFILLIYIYEFDFDDTKFSLINFLLYIKYQL